LSFTRELRMIETYQKLLQQWAALAPDEGSTTDRDYRFKIKILPKVEKCSFDNPWRSVTSENLIWRLHVAEDVILRQLNFVLLTVLHRCSDRQSNIHFTFIELGTIATRKQWAEVANTSTSSDRSIRRIHSITGVLEGGT
jgi:hypothetical protein